MARFGHVLRPSFIPLCVLLVSYIDLHAVAYTESETFGYINEILSKLNDNNACRLPSFAEVDELQECFRELEMQYGQDLESKLDHDQNLVRATLLDQWDSFQKRMNDAVVIRSAKKRAFLGKIEKYQKAKFGDSVCTRLSSGLRTVPDTVFEKNPIVRYVKHLETKQVAEQTDRVPEVMMSHLDAVPPKEDREPEESEKVAAEPEEHEQQQQKETTESKESEEVATEAVADEVEPLTDAPSDKPKEEPQALNETVVDSTGVVHQKIGESNPDEINLNYTPESSDDEGYDPLSELPEPTGSEYSGQSSDDDLAQMAGKQTQLEGVEYVDEATNDKMLAQLVRVRKRHVEPDPEMDSYMIEWPDESRITRNEQKAVRQQYDQETTEWNEFLKNPFPEPEAPAEPKLTFPSVNMSTIHLKKQDYLEDAAMKSRMANLFTSHTDKFTMFDESDLRRKVHVDRRRKKTSSDRSVNSPMPQQQPPQQLPNPFAANQQPAMMNFHQSQPMPSMSMFQPQQQPSMFHQPTMQQQSMMPMQQQPNMFNQMHQMQQSPMQQQNFMQQTPMFQQQQPMHQMANYQQHPMQQAPMMPQQTMYSSPMGFQQQPFVQQPIQQQQPMFMQQQPMNQPSMFNGPMMQQQQPTMMQQQPMQQQFMFQHPQQSMNDVVSPVEQPKSSKSNKASKKKTPNVQKWSNVADNNFCKIDYNTEYIPKHVKSATSWVKSKTAIAARKVLNAVEEKD